MPDRDPTEGMNFLSASEFHSRGNVKSGKRLKVAK
jgi:hypothetical protein